MRIQSVNTYRPQTFKGATISINAFSDSHGELSLANNALEEMRARKNGIFTPQKLGCKNITAVSGDWFIDGSRKGYLSHPEMPNGIFQLTIFNKFITELRKLAPDNTTIFTPGNHEFDGGVSLLNEIFSELDAEILMTNLNTEESTAFEDVIKENKLVTQKIIEVEDNKNPNLKHKVLFLGVSPVNLVSYQQNLSGVTLIDNVNKAQASVQPENYKKTFDFCKEKIAEFKKANPKGLVVLLSHTGVNFADNLVKESDVDLVFDGHEHKEDVRLVNGTPIIPLSQNFKRIVNTRLKIDDNGELDSLKIKLFSPLNNPIKGCLSRLYRELFKKDIEKKYSIRTDNPSVNTLEMLNIRTGNSHLANFVTDSVLNEIRKKDETIDFFALNSSAIRHPLAVSKEAGVSPFDVLNVLGGIKEEDGQIMTTEVTGNELAMLVVDNISFNKIDQNKNPLIHYSGLIVDRTNILKALEEGKEPETLTKYIRNANTGKLINPRKKYKIANVEKYFNKSSNSNIKEMKNRSEFLGFSVQEAFKNHFDSSNGRLYAKCEQRIK